ncbi:MAG: hypothetical protein R3E31_20180 [Chloroflexota bacterium]
MASRTGNGARLNLLGEDGATAVADHLVLTTVTVRWSASGSRQLPTTTFRFIALQANAV